MPRPPEKSPNPVNRPELLAPAGGLPAFFAALEAGADAVYCGLTSFSARANAKNFTIDEVARMAAFAHSLDRKLYVALNTLIKEQELPLLLDTLAGLSDTGVDGLIIQDLAVWRLARQHFPELPLHASTQMTIHNAAGVSQLATMGFTRAVLARELTLAEIAAIGKRSRIELEHFVHGALCFSISGQCLFSSLLTGKSGNRGRCVQPCRRRYSHQEKPGHYFSTSDLCAIDHLPSLIEAGVKSFKIEGRMKSPEYVGRVVAAYRLVLDAPAKGRKAALELARQELELSFGREATSGFLTGSLPNAIAAPGRAATIGRHLGRVTAVRGRTVLIKLADRLHIGDRVKIMPANDQTGVGLTVLRLLVKGKLSKVATGGEVGVECAVAERIHPGDEVYKVAAEQAYGLDEAACRKRLAAAGVAKSASDLRLDLRLTSDTLFIRGEAADIILEASYPVSSSPATTHPLDQATLLRTFDKTGALPLLLKKLRAKNLPPLVIPPSRLNEIRRDFYQRLIEELARADQEKSRHRREVAGAALLPLIMPRPAPRHLTVTVSRAADLRLLEEPAVNRVALSLNPNNVKGAEAVRLTPAQRKRIIWDIPAIIFPADWDDFRGVIGRLRRQGYPSFRLNNLGHLGFFSERTSLELLAGATLYAMNSQAGLAWKELGLTEITLPLESDRENLTALLTRALGLPLNLTAYAPLELLTSRIPLRGIRPGDRLRSDQGEELRLINVQGLTVLNSSSDFSLLDQLNELPEATRLHVDLSHCGPFSPRGRSVLAAICRAGSPLPDTTAFNFLRGLE
ncbi:MAG: U32 family peptidase [Desulfobulbaceae bacterium]|nr:U32 family peptidase [Desulfobulbaceae bacterium]